LEKLAFAMAESELVKPGPAVTKATAGWRVILPIASAMNTAACSCRVSTSVIGEFSRYW
jgi:hypothetical protein